MLIFVYKTKSFFIQTTYETTLMTVYVFYIIF